MIYAYDQDQQLRHADSVLVKKDRFYCPGCQEQVIWKGGRSRRPHFAHRNNASCRTFSEGETQEHLAAKACLYDWFQPMPVQIECFLPELNQRPDLRCCRQVIEIQCSPITMKAFLSRTTGYLSAGYQPWWILGSRLQPKKRWHEIAKASCTYDENGFSLWGIDTERQCLIKYTDIHWHYQYGVGSHCIWFSEGSPFDKTTLRPITKQQPIHQNRKPLWQANGYQCWLLQQLIKKTPCIMKIQALLYSLHGHVARLPFWCYQDSRFAFLFEHRLLVMRFCFHMDPKQSFTRWLDKLRLIDWSWAYPLLDQTRILFALFHECQQLEEIFQFQNQ